MEHPVLKNESGEMRQKGEEVRDSELFNNCEATIGMRLTTHHGFEASLNKKSHCTAMPMQWHRFFQIKVDTDCS